MKRATSRDVFHRISEEAFRKIIAESKSIREVFNHMSICVSGDQYRPFRRRVEELDIDLSHFRGTYDKSSRFRCELPIERVFKEGTHHGSAMLSGKVRKHNLLPYECTICHNPGTWQDKPIALQLDHINGINTDNRIENLRYLCPNCHTQTDTYAGKKHKVHKHCAQCGKPCGRKATVCITCSRVQTYDRCLAPIARRRSIERPWPDREIIVRDVWLKPIHALATGYGYSDKALKKHCQRLGIVVPPVGYWNRRQSGYTHTEAMVSQAKVRPPKRVMTKEQVQNARDRILAGEKLRAVARTMGFAHSTLMRAMRDPDR